MHMCVTDVLSLCFVIVWSLSRLTNRLNETEYNSVIMIPDMLIDLQLKETFKKHFMCDKSTEATSRTLSHLTLSSYTCPECGPATSVHSFKGHLRNG